MSLEDVYFISQIVAAVAILFSLVFVALQLRQNTEQLRRSQRAYVNTFEATGSGFVQNVMLTLATDEKLSELVSRGRLGLSNLSEAEQARFGYYLLASLQHVQFAYIAYRNGSSDDDIWRGHAGTLSPLLRSPGVRDWWRKRRLLFLPLFRQFIDGLAGDGPLQPPGLPMDHPHAATSIAADKPVAGATSDSCQ